MSLPAALEGAPAVATGTALHSTPAPLPTAPPQQIGAAGLAPLTPAQMAEDRSPAIYASCTVCIVLCVVSFGGLLAARRLARAGARRSDWILLPGVLCSVAMAGCYLWSAKAGAGRRFLALLAESLDMDRIGQSQEVSFWVALGPRRRLRSRKG